MSKAIDILSELHICEKTNVLFNPIGKSRMLEIVIALNEVKRYKEALEILQDQFESQLDSKQSSNKGFWLALKNITKKALKET